MVNGDAIIVRMIDEARRQSPGILDRLLESYRNYLRLLRAGASTARYAAKLIPPTWSRKRSSKRTSTLTSFEGRRKRSWAGTLAARSRKATGVSLVRGKFAEVDLGLRDPRSDDRLFPNGAWRMSY